jgi:hypothetical protein
MLKIKSEKDSIDKNDNTLIRYLLDDYIYIVNRKSLINSITDENLIYNCYEKLFLLISLKELKQVNNSSEIISILNTIILCSLSTELSLNMAINHSAIGIAGIMPNTKTVIKSHPSAKDRDITTIISIAALHAFKVTYHSLSPESYEIFLRMVKSSRTSNILFL